MVMEEMWSTVHNAGRKPTAGSRPMKRRWSTASWRRIVCVCRFTDHWGTFTFTRGLPSDFGNRRRGY